MKELKRAPWMIVAGALRKDAPFFGGVGLFCGILQFVGYRYFDKANWGAELLLEHIPFKSILFSVVFLGVAKGFLEWQRAKREMMGLEGLITHVAKRTIGFASPAASIVFGFAMASALWGAYWHAGMFLFCCIYLVALAEIAANPLFGKGCSKAYSVAVGVIIAMPIAL